LAEERLESLEKEQVALQQMLQTLENSAAEAERSSGLFKHRSFLYIDVSFTFVFVV
jgi:hypothetical protein